MSSSTTRFQRVGIWVITIVTIVGTLLSFLIMIVSSQNSTADSNAQSAAIAKYQADYTSYLDKMKSLDSKYYEKMLTYDSYAATFDKNSVTKLATSDLEVGSGDVIDSKSSYVAYYVGWNPDGKIFDSSIDSTNKTLKDPIAGANLIQGWMDGVIGMKYGGVRELTIPSDQAYGKTGQGELIPANTPLKFIVFIVPKDETYTAPNISDYYKQN